MHGDDNGAGAQYARQQSSGDVPPGSMRGRNGVAGELTTIAVWSMAQSPSEVPGGRGGITRRVGRLQIALVNCASCDGDTCAGCAVGS